MNPALELGLLGPLRLHPPALAPGHPLALLALLVVDGPTSREAAAALLWPESRQPRADLRQALHRLRHSLPQAAVPALQADRNQVQLHPEYPLESDVTPFLEAVRRGREAEMDTLREGVEAYRGPLLEGFPPGASGPFGEWLQARRSWFRGQARLLYRHLAQRELAAGDRDAAVRTVSAFVRREPDDATGHQQLDEILNQSEQQAEPTQVTRLESRPASGLQHRHLVVVCCDPCPPAEATEAVVVAEISRLRQLCRLHLQESGARVELGPDGIVVGYFGLPPRAGRAATDAITAAFRLLESGEEPLPIRVGIHAGRALSASNGHPDYLGTIVRRARLATVATPLGELRLTKGAAAALPAGWTTQLSNEFDPAEALLTVSAPPTLNMLQTPMTGRRRERAHLLAAARRLRQGAGGGHLIRGEPGMGKSRLAAAVRDRVAHRITAITVGVDGTSTARPLEPFLQFVEQLAALQPDQGRAERRRRIEVFLHDMLGEEIDHDTILQLLLEPHQEGDELPRAADEALVELVLVRAAAHPLMLIVEDIHAADEASLRTLAALARRTAEQPLLLVATSRPDGPSVAGLRPLELGPLEPDEAEALIRQVAPAPVDAETRQTLARMSEGLPLFAEELARTARRGMTQAAPPSLAQLATDRLDAVGAAARTARLLALIGREAPDHLLAWLEERPREEVTGHLQRLEASNLILRRHGREGTFYRIKHALLEQAFYDSLPPGEAARLHRRLAEGMEAEFPAEARARPAWLADHHRRAGNAAAAARLYLDAARQAGRFGAHQAAARFRHQSQDQIESLAAGEQRNDLARELDQLTALQGLTTTDHATSRAVLERQSRADPREDFDAALSQIIGAIHSTPWDDLFPRAQEMLVHAQASQDPQRLHTARHLLGFIANYTGRLHLALEQFEALLAEEDRGEPPELLLQTYSGPPWPVELAYLSILNLGQGREALSREQRDQAISGAREHGGGNLVAHVLVLMSARARHAEEPEEALTLATEVGRLSREERLSNPRLVGRSCVTWARARLGRAASVDRMFRLAEHEGGNAAVFAQSAYLVPALGAQGRHHSAIARIHDLCHGPDQHYVSTNARPLIGLQLGVSLAAQGRLESALAALENARDQARDNGNPLQLARIAFHLAELQERLDRPEDADTTRRTIAAELPADADAGPIISLRRYGA